MGNHLGLSFMIMTGANPLFVTTSGPLSPTYTKNIMRVQIDSTGLAATSTKCPEAKTRLIRRKLLRSMT